MVYETRLHPLNISEEPQQHPLPNHPFNFILQCVALLSVMAMVQMELAPLGFVPLVGWSFKPLWLPQQLLLLNGLKDVFNREGQWGVGLRAPFCLL